METVLVGVLDIVAVTLVDIVGKLIGLAGTVSDIVENSLIGSVDMMIGLVNIVFETVVETVGNS